MPDHTCVIPKSRYCYACFLEGACSHACQADDPYECEELKHRARNGRRAPEFPVEPCPCSICHDPTE